MTTERSEAAARDGAGDPSPDAAERRELWKVWGPVAALALVATLIAFAYLEPPAPDVLRLAAGSRDGAYHGFAERYRELLAEHDKELIVVETAGSVENLRLLAEDRVDLALLQGGIAADGAPPTLESVASLFFEPVWLFHRDDLEIELLTDLAGLRVAVGAAESGTRRLVEQLLAENGLEQADRGQTGPGQRGPGEVDPAATASAGADPIDAGAGPLRRLEIGGAEAAAALRDGRADAAFFVASPDAGYVRALLATGGLELMSFRRQRAYRVAHPFLSPVVLGEGVVDLGRNLPPRDVELIAAAAALVAADDLHHALVPLLVETAKQVHGGVGPFAERGTFPAASWVDLPLKNDAEHYLENGPSFLFRVLPYRTAVSVDRLKIFLLPFIPLLLVIFKAAPPIYRWRIRSKIFRWYRDLRALDQFILGGPSPAEAVPKLDELRRLEAEVIEVSVPLSYMDAFYDLRVHIELIEQKLEEIVRADPGLE